MLNLIDPKEFLEKCFKCIHCRKSFGCGTTLCDLGLSWPCHACAIANKGIENELQVCKEFSEKKLCPQC